MDRRTAFTLLGTLLFVTTALAGCIGGAEAATASTARRTADREAQDWEDKPRLVNIYGWEGPYRAASFGPSARYAEQPYYDRAAEDANVGDGKAAIWVFRYLSEDGEKVLEVVVDADGKVRDRRVVDADDGDVLLGEVNVDSDRAVEIAAQDEDFRERMRSERSHVMMMLDREPDQEHARWKVGVISQDGFAGAVIDAVTGDVIQRFDSEDRPYPDKRTTRSAP